MNQQRTVGTVMRAMRKGDTVTLIIDDRTIGTVCLSHVPNGAKCKVAFTFDRAVRIESERLPRSKAK